MSEGTWAHEAFLASPAPRAHLVPRASQENQALRDPKDRLALQERWDPRGRRGQWENQAFLGKPA